jgi:osmotically-inducible protein OsmY
MTGRPGFQAVALVLVLLPFFWGLAPAEPVNAPRTGAVQSMQGASDAQLVQDIRSALFWHAAVDAKAISVLARDGVVELTGFVPTLGARHDAEETAVQAGARRLINNLKIVSQPR